ncbi:hypothetical protein Poly41_32300 [Novipirellula artificiosorum]|uniref:Uncharacterized protein n=1 Tax=Novipirellula artificiosorum TaxID=2528016 RepID=A0A5C6DIA6_9BACT|nr:hypothetical protein Poly41_32300 [Novipirellula artificiosorum]
MSSTSARSVDRTNRSHLGAVRCTPSSPVLLPRKDVVRYLSCDEHSVSVSNHPCPRSVRCTPHPNPVIFFWLLVRMCSMRWTGRGSVTFRSTRTTSLVRFLRRCKLAEALAHIGFSAHPAEACAGGFRGISPVSHDCWQELFSLVIVQLPGRNGVELCRVAT